MIFNILHKTVINYDYAPLSGIQKLRLTPRDEINQKILDWKIDFNGCSVELETYDYQGNKIQLCKTKNDVKKIVIKSYGRLKVKDNNGIVGSHVGNIPIDLYKFSSSNYTKPGRRVIEIVKNLMNMSKKEKKTELQLLNSLSKKILQLSLIHI